MIQNERGAVFPTTLLFSLIAFFIMSQAAMIYVSQCGYMIEMRDYYKEESSKLLHGYFSSENESKAQLHYYEEALRGK